MGAALSYVASAGVAMVQMGLFCLVGVAFGILPRSTGGLLNGDAMKSISSQVYWLYTPALLIATFGAKLSLQILYDTVGVMGWSVIHAGLNFLLGGLLYPRLFPVERRFRATFTLAVTFNNAVSVPLLIFSGLVKSPELLDDVTAYDRAVVYIFAYAMAWNLIFWSVGTHVMESDAAALRAEEERQVHAASAPSEGVAVGETASDAGGKAAAAEDTYAPQGQAHVPEIGAGAGRQQETEGEDVVHTTGGGGGGASFIVYLRSMHLPSLATLLPPQRTNVWGVLKKAFLTPAVIGIVIGVVIGVWQDLRVALFVRGGALQPVGDVLTLLGQPSIPLSNLILAGSLYHGMLDLYHRHQPLVDAWIAWFTSCGRAAPAIALEGGADAAAEPSAGTASAPNTSGMTAMLLPASASIVPVSAEMVRHMASLRGERGAARMTAATAAQLNVDDGTEVMLVTFRRPTLSASAAPDQQAATGRQARQHASFVSTGDGMNQLPVPPMQSRAAAVRAKLSAAPHWSEDTGGIRRTTSYSEGTAAHVLQHHALSRFRLPGVEPAGALSMDVQRILHNIEELRDADGGHPWAASRGMWSGDAHMHMQTDDHDSASDGLSRSLSRRTLSGRARAISVALSAGAPVVIAMDDALQQRALEGDGTRTPVRARRTEAITPGLRERSGAAAVAALPGSTTGRRGLSSLRENDSCNDLEALVGRDQPGAATLAIKGDDASASSAVATTGAAVAPVPAHAAPTLQAPPSGVSLRTAIALILLRLVICPAIMFLLFVAAEGMRIPILAPGAAAQDNVLRLVVLVEAASPAAQSVLLLCQTTGNVAAAKDLSLVYVALYPLSLITLTVALTVAMAIVFS